MPHTPAPWTTYPMPTKHHSEARANLTLAIAAPDLLAALKELRAKAYDEIGMHSDELLDLFARCDAAIAKAER